MTKLRRIADDLRNPVTLGIGVTTTIGYGTMYYALAVFAPVISADFSIGLDIFFALFAAGLFLGGLLAPAIGRTTDRFGARVVMSVGALLAALALLLIATAANLWMLAIGIVLLEIAGCMVLYETAFAGLTQIFRQGARRHITSVTLIAGFASTIFWPMTQFAVSEIGWRATCVVFAAIHLAICLPLNRRSLVAARPLVTATPDMPEPDEAPFLLGPARRRAFLIYASAICLSGAVFASLPVHMILILQGEGMTAQTAALIAMVMGPAQVAARLLEIMAEGRHTALVTGRICLTTLPLALGVLVLPGGAVWTAVLFAALYGVAQGLGNIMRGTVPLYLFGVRGYGALTGRITGLRFVLNAGAPFGFAYLATQAGLDVSLWACALLATLGALLFWRLRGPGATDGL